MATIILCDVCNKPAVGIVKVSIDCVGVVNDQNTGSTLNMEVCDVCRPDALLLMATKLIASIESAIPLQKEIIKESENYNALQIKLHDAAVARNEFADAYSVEGSDGTRWAHPSKLAEYSKLDANVKQVQADITASVAARTELLARV